MTEPLKPRHAVCTVCGWKYIRTTLYGPCTRRKCGGEIQWAPHNESQWEKAIAAIRKFRPGVGAEIAQSEIVVVVWEADKATFSMPGYDYPDSKKIAVLICRMIDLGLLVRIRQLTYLVVQ